MIDCKNNKTFAQYKAEDNQETPLEALLVLVVFLTSFVAVCGLLSLFTKL